MRHLLNVIVAMAVSWLAVIGWKPLLGLESFDVDIEITALGKGNPQSASTEVWLRLLDWPPGASLDDFLRAATPKDSWEKRDTALVSYKNQPARVGWSGKVGPRASLVLTRHDWSGDASVRINGTVTTYDLYAPSGANSELVITLKRVPSVFRDSLLSVPGTLLPAGLLAIAILAIFYAATHVGRTRFRTA